jgi:hypothetical protein
VSDDDLIPVEVRAEAVAARLAAHGVVVLAADPPPGWTDDQTERARERMREVVEHLGDRVQVFESDGGGFTLYPACPN